MNKGYVVVFIDAGNCDIATTDVFAYSFEHALSLAREWYVTQGLLTDDIARIDIEIV